MKKHIITLTASVFFAILLFFEIISPSYTACALTVLPTTTDTPSEDCVFLGIEGKYITQIDQALNRINAIRKEACNEGVRNPKTDEPLTPSDYVPVQWDADLEYIARIRAAESSVTVNHARTNGESIWFNSPNGVRSYTEVLAWNSSENMLLGISQWYNEKNNWVNNTGRSTGHYTAMIDPDNCYVGLATFCTKSAKIYNTTAGEFSSSSSDSTRGVASGNIIQTLEVKNEYITSYEINCPDNLSGVDKITVTASVEYDGYKSKGLIFMDNNTEQIKWSSSNSDITVSNGVITAKSSGDAVITAELPDGRIITKSVSASNPIIPSSSSSSAQSSSSAPSPSSSSAPSSSSSSYSSSDEPAFESSSSDTASSAPSSSVSQNSSSSASSENNIQSENSSDNSDSTSNLSDRADTFGLWVSIAVGGGLLLIAAGVFVFLLIKRRKH